MNRPKQDVSDLWIQHQRRNTKTTKSWACIYCTNRAIFLSESDLWMHAQNNHEDKLPSTPEESKQFRKSYDVNSASKRPTRLCEKGHLHDKAIREDRSNKRTAEGGGISVDKESPSCEHWENPPPRRSPSRPTSVPVFRAKTSSWVRDGDSDQISEIPISSLGPSKPHSTVNSKPPPRRYNAKQSHDNESPHSRARSQSEKDKIYFQQKPRPISQEQLVAEVKGIYAGLVMVEAKCIEVDNKQATLVQGDPPTLPRLNNEQWQALIALHRTLLHEHHDFFLASQYLPSSPGLRRLASENAIPARMWLHFLELWGDQLLTPLDHMDGSIHLAYLVINTMYECRPSGDWFCSTGEEEEYRGLLANLKEQKYRPHRARHISPNETWSHNPSSSQNISTNRSMEHRDNVVHDTKLKIADRARSKEMSPTGLTLTPLSFLSKLLTSLGHKKRVFTKLVIANTMTVVSGMVIPPKNSDTTITLTSPNDSTAIQTLLDKSLRLLNLSSEAAIALSVIAISEAIRRMFCREVQNRLLSATCMAASMSCFAYLRDAEDVTGGLLAGLMVAGAAFTWNTFSLGMEKYNFGTPYVVLGMTLGITILGIGYPHFQPLIGSVKIDIFFLPAITCAFSLLEMCIKFHENMLR